MKLDLRNIGLTAAREILGATLIFSSIVKCVDPVGTAIFVEKYLATYSLEVLLPLATAIAITLAVAEFALGMLLIDRVFYRAVSTITLALIFTFTIVTLLNATVLPIGECGCFGNAFELTPWQTFAKNVVLLTLAIVVWVSAKGDNQRRNYLSLTLAIVIPLAINLYALRHLPIIDFMPYDKGTNLRESVLEERRLASEGVQSWLKFRNLTTDEEVLFEATNSDCWLDEELEFVEVVAISSKLPEMVFGDFHLYNNAGEDVTHDVLLHSGRVALLCVNDSVISKRQLCGIETLKSEYSNDDILILRAVPVEGEWTDGIEQLRVDAMTLRSIIRADVGVVVLNDGIVELKSNIIDL